MASRIGWCARPCWSVLTQAERLRVILCRVFAWSVLPDPKFLSHSGLLTAKFKSVIDLKTVFVTIFLLLHVNIYHVIIIIFDQTFVIVSKHCNQWSVSCNYHNIPEFIAAFKCSISVINDVFIKIIKEKIWFTSMPSYANWSKTDTWFYWMKIFINIVDSEQWIHIYYFLIVLNDSSFRTILSML